jgi:hypothetical protein
MWFLAKLFMLLEEVLPQTLPLPTLYCSFYSYVNESCPTGASPRGAIVDGHGLEMVLFWSFSCGLLVAKSTQSIQISIPWNLESNNRELSSEFWTLDHNHHNKQQGDDASSIATLTLLLWQRGGGGGGGGGE